MKKEIILTERNTSYNELSRFFKGRSMVPNSNGVVT